MSRHFGDGVSGSLDSSAAADIARSGRLNALLAFERIGVRRSVPREAQIYAEGDSAGSWYRVISGTVRICKLLADGRRHIAEFCFAGDCFGLGDRPERVFSAEAVGDVVIMRYPRRASERLIDADPRLARHVREMALRDLAQAQGRLLLLGRMTACERVARFLLEMAERREADLTLDVPMSRHDIADYLGLTVETVCRVLSAFKRAGAIATLDPHSIELRDRRALETIGEV
ncbi:MAG TPA: helix-turn-helix domain-containing protein [Stellaceae bacterium]|nr:helix-turn-helix domain-containing protein [Stellaceae bacterium]